MTDSFSQPGGLDVLPLRAAEAAAALESLKGPGEAAAKAIEDAFGKAGDSLTRSLARAAADGKITLQELARAVIGAANAGFGSGGLAGALTSAVSYFGGARAGGGPVLPGGAYLVGEHGPEVFRPAGAGQIDPGGAQGVTVNVSLQGEGVQGLLRSEAQIAAALARAVSLGARRF